MYYHIYHNLGLAIEDLEKQASDHRKNAERWRDASSRVVHRGDGPNYAAMAFKHKAQAEERQAEDRDDRRKMAMEMRRLLKDYEWRAEVETETTMEESYSKLLEKYGLKTIKS